MEKSRPDKKSGRDFGWAGGIRTHEMQESKSCALPLGDSPINDIEKRLLSSLKAFFMGWVVRVELTTSRATIWRPNQLGHTHHMARQERLELPTYCLEGSCSIQLSYWRIFMERVMGIEPTRPAWKAGILPLNYTRVATFIIIHNTLQNVKSFFNLF